MGLFEMFSQTDAVGKFVAIVLLLMSLASWALIVWKAKLLWQAKVDVSRCVSAFWQAPDWAAAQAQVATLDRVQMVSPLLTAAGQTHQANMAAQTDRAQQLTRQLRDTLHTTITRLQYGQVMLATVGSTAPFVGLFGTVWGIYHALVGLTGEAQVGIDKIAGPVGEALIMTAAGLAVAIPAVLAYNVFGKRVGLIEAELEGFAFDLRELLSAKP